LQVANLSRRMNPSLISKSPRLMARLIASGLAKLPDKPKVARRYRGGMALAERVRAEAFKQVGPFNHTAIRLPGVSNRKVRRILRYLSQRGELWIEVGTGSNPSTYCRFSE